jgi:hypothetical protein
LFRRKKPAAGERNGISRKHGVCNREGGTTLSDASKNTKSKFVIGDLSSWQKRRRALKLLLSELERLRFEEEAYMMRIPENLRESDAHTDAECTVDLLTDALSLLDDVY